MALALIHFYIDVLDHGIFLLNERFYLVDLFADEPGDPIGMVRRKSLEPLEIVMHVFELLAQIRFAIRSSRERRAIEFNLALDAIHSLS